jgi:hypothetical protein
MVAHRPTFARDRSVFSVDRSLGDEHWTICLRHEQGAGDE